MLQKLFKKLVYMSTVIMGIVIFVFFLFHIFAKDPAQLLAGQRTDVQTLENIRKELNLDQPIWKRFLLYLTDVSPVSVHSSENKRYQRYDYVKVCEAFHTVIILKKPYLGRSYQTNEKVWGVVVSHLYGTLLLSVFALLFATIVGIMAGVTATLYKKTALDYCIQLFTTLGISLPSFFAALLISWFFGYYLQTYTGLPPAGYTEQFNPLTLRFYYDWRYLLLPTFTLGIRPAAIITALMRSSMTEVLQEDYIRTARAKGMNPFQVIFRHALRNALNPVISAVSNWLASLIAGAFFVEYIFSWKGLGYLTVQALEQQDFPILMGVVLFLGIFFVLINFMTDLLYQITDPRVRV
jgi:peptide/nickel transport system permease protein